MADGTIGGLTANGERPVVAIVGGTPAGATVATILIEQFGCDPRRVPTGEAVLSLLREERRVDLVVLDLSVSDMDGIVAVQLIRALGARGTLPVIALTNDRAEIATPRARAAGFAAAVVKPYSPRELFAAMETALAEQPMAAAAVH